MESYEPVGEIDLVNVSSPTLRTHRATVLAHQAEYFDVRIDDGPAANLNVGAVVVLNWRDDPNHPRVTATVISADGVFVRAIEKKRTPRDKRVFPRTVGGISLRYRLVYTDDPEVVAARWMAGRDDLAAPSEWREPDPFMNFSASGLRFEDSLSVELGDIVLCDVSVGANPTRWRAVATVMRIFPIAPEHRDVPDATHHVAVMFMDAPVLLVEALEAYTLQLQRLTFGLP